MKSSIDSFAVNIPPRSVPYSMRREGEFIVITESTFPLQINIPGLTVGFIKCQLGIEYRAFAGERFPEVIFQNSDPDLACSIEGYIGFGKIEDRRLNVVATRAGQFVLFAEAPTQLFALTESGGAYIGGVISAGSSAEASGALSGYGRRKHFYVSNDDPTLNLEIFEKTGNKRCAIVFPKTSFLLESSSALYVKNPNASPVSCAISETFYIIA